METINLADGVGNAVTRAAEVLRQGGVILYPTDTLYGLGADALSDTAVAKIYDIKGRESGKPTHCIVPSLEIAAEYAEVNDIARSLADRFLPGPLTLILKKKPTIEGGITRGIDTIGIRIPNNEFCVALVKTFGKPVTTPSANRAGVTPASTPEAILAQLGKKASLIDLVIDAGELPARAPSTIVSCVTDVPSILREGAIPSSAILT